MHPTPARRLRRTPTIDEQRLRALLVAVERGETTVADAVERLRTLPFEDLGDLRLDHHRGIRDALPEVVLAQGKTPDQAVRAALAILARAERLLVTRVDAATAAALRAAIPDLRPHPPSTTWSVDRRDGLPPPRPGIVAVSGGAADLPVLEEAVATAALMGHAVDRIVDVGVAGLHRLLPELPRIRRAHVIIAVAGMDAALPSVVAGLTAQPVIAVPTSTGYGAAFEGLAALLALMNACAPGVSVMNIDNGFGAGYQAALVNTLATATVPPPTPAAP